MDSRMAYKNNCKLDPILSDKQRQQMETHSKCSIAKGDKGFHLVVDPLACK